MRCIVNSFKIDECPGIYDFGHLPGHIYVEGICPNFKRPGILPHNDCAPPPPPLLLGRVQLVG